MEAKATAATFGHDVTWHEVDWAKVHRVVRRLQARIVKVVQNAMMNGRLYPGRIRLIEARAGCGESRTSGSSGGRVSERNPSYPN